MYSRFSDIPSINEEAVVAIRKLAALINLKALSKLLKSQ